MKQIVNAGQSNSRLLYYLANISRFSLPDALYRRKRLRLLHNLDRFNLDYVYDRVNYYNKISGPFELNPEAAPFHFSFFKGQRNYYMDLYEYTRYFDPALKLNYRFGDMTRIPHHPAIIKARPVAGDNRNSVLLNLNKIRHFTFIHDALDFKDKQDKLVWRGNAGQKNRKVFLSQFYGRANCDVGHAHRRHQNEHWPATFLSIRNQLKYKFVLSLEGHDVASNLKWIMSSNSLCVMTRPRFETWFMEGRLVPGLHFALLNDDFSNLDEIIEHYSSHEAEALAIIRNANQYVDQFRDQATEDIISLLVLNKYFELSGQLPFAAK